MSASLDPPSPESLLEHADFLRSLARRLVEDPSTADDLLQETYVSAIEKPPQRVAKLRPWLAGVLRNLARERARGEGRRARREKAVARPEALPGTVEIVERIEAFRDLARDVVRLDEPYRTAILLRFFEGLSADEIAAREGVPAATIRSRQKRALDKLRERLDRRHGDRRAWCLLFARWMRDQPLRPALALPSAFPTVALFAGLAALVLLVAAIRARSVDELDRGAPIELARAAPDEVARDASSSLAVAEASAEDARRSALAPSAQPDSAAGARSILRLRLFDASTGEPLVHFQVEATRRAGQVERLASDAEGRIATTAPFEHGDVGLYLIDHPALAAWREIPRTTRPLRWSIPHAHLDGSERELRLAIGPTWRLELELPAGLALDDLEAALCSSDPFAPLAECVAPLRAPADATDRAWVRFSNEVGALAGPKPWSLEVRAKKGFWRGAVHVDTLGGRAQDRLEVALEPTGVLVVLPVTGTGDPLEAWLELEGRDGRRAFGRSARHEVRWLAPGAYVVHTRASESGWQHDAASVEVRPGETVEVRAVHVQADRERTGTGSVRGLVTAESGRLAEDAVVWLCDAAGDVVGHQRIRADSRGRGAYAFDGLRPGKYELSLTSHSVYRWRPAQRTVSPGVDGVDDADFLALDAGPKDGLVFRAFDEVSGLELQQLEVLLAVDGWEERVARRTSHGAVSYVGVPAGARLAWTLCAQGYRLARGDERDLADSNGPDGRNGRREGYVRLARGFEREIWVRTGAHGEPLAALPVLVDGNVVAATDQRGFVLLSLAAPPRSIEVAGARALSGIPSTSFRTIFVRPR